MELVTRKEAAKYLKMSPVTLAIWDKKFPDRIPAIKLPNGRVRYDMAAIQAFLESCRRQPEEETVQN